MVAPDEARGQWVERVVESLEKRSFVKLTLSGNANAPAAGAHLQRLRRVQGRLIQIKRGPRLQLTLKFEHRDEVRNLEIGAVGDALADYVGASACRNARLFSSEGDLELAYSRRGAPRLLELAPALAAPAAPVAHDRRKRGRGDAAAETHLVALGVTTPEGTPRAGQAAKLRQIRQFTEQLLQIVGAPPAGGAPLRVCDVGCGRGYLTFAAHSALAAAGWRVRTTGVELRPALVHEVEGIARRLGAPFEGLGFVEGAIASLLAPPPAGAPPREGLDVLVALHACDTATDDALWCGVLRGARVVVVAPCCHKEIRRQLDPHAAAAARAAASDHPLAALLRHGIFRERAAEMATDAARALLLEVAGYDVRVFEFVALEQTAKNVLIAATRRETPRAAAELEAKRRELRSLLGLFGAEEQRLARWMGELPHASDARAPAPSGGASAREPHPAAGPPPSPPAAAAWRGRPPAPRLS